MKGRYLRGEWWRLFTGPWLHGNPLHWAMNAAALLYLGRRTEVLARWPHLALVLLVSALAGGIASVKWLAAPTVGISGGLLGLLGFLLVFETLHRRLVPVTARRRLLAGVVVIAMMGLFGFRFIDNAAHAGGLIAGMAYALLVFPPSSPPLRPKILHRDAVAGSLALALLTAGAALACWKIL
jgi:membrane associated rhomboid family serine protease